MTNTSKAISSILCKDLAVNKWISAEIVRRLYVHKFKN